MNIHERIGYMQGRLSPLSEGRIQSFPWRHWQAEFPAAGGIGIGMMEWTLDQERLHDNPLMMRDGQEEIRQLCSRYSFRIPSLTGDCFMQAPFWKASGAQRGALEEDFLAVARACTAVGISMIVVPLVDNGRLDNPGQEDRLIGFLEAQTKLLGAAGLQLVFESDFNPEELARFIGRLDPGLFGINYDIGNSAGLGYRPSEEFAAYGRRVLNVHVKDRIIGGTTVPLGTGSADFEAVFNELGRISYRGNFILQTARAIDEDHATPLSRYRDMTALWMSRSGLANP